ncbi:MAG: LysM peptidoglycan-binding domain-containing protein [Bacillota bacterium]
MSKSKIIFLLSTFFFSLSLFPAASAWASDLAHRVKPGESLNSISSYHNIELDKLLNANPFIEYPYAIYPGQVIVIPDTRPGQKYTVKPGDTLISIADRYGTELNP